MAVASPSNDNETSVDSFPSTPLTSKQGSEYGSENSSAVGSKRIDLSEPNYQSDSSVHSRRDAEIQSPAYLKSEEYRLLFRLPPDEMLVQDFNCAFQESILLQGHMYLFVRHICFYSNIFGFETKKTISLNELTCVRKAKTAAIFPNAIEIVAGGKKFFFASFLSRDEAYRLIVDGWSQHCNGTEVLIDHQDLKSEIKNEDSSCHVLERSKRCEQQTDDYKYSDRNKNGEPSGDCKLLSITEDEATLMSNPSEAQENGEEDGEEANVNPEQFSSEEPLTWKVENADAPKVPDYYTKVAESKFPIQVEEFFDLFCSDKAINFIYAFHTKCGDKDFRCTSWSEHTESGHTREKSFQHPIKIYFGAKFGNCHEVQKFRVYNNSRLIIETSQEVTDVPYADYFRVQGLWVVEGAGNETNKYCTLRVYVNVNFLKRTMWKGKIEQSTVEECREAYALWLNEAHELLKQKNLEKPVGTISEMIPSEAQSEGQERDENHLKRLHDSSTNVLQIPLMSSETINVSPRRENSSRGGFSISPLVKESLARFSSSLKNQNHLPLFLAIAFILILLMQVSIVILLSRTPQVHVISQLDYMNQIGSPRNDVAAAEAEAWLEKRVRYLKDEMQSVGSRLESMREEYGLLKEHFKSLEQQRKARH